MTAESLHFCFAAIHWTFKPRNSIAPDRNVRDMVKAGLRELTVKCKDCGHSWYSASRGSGCFIERAGGNLTFTCPQCETSETILLSALD